MRKDLTEFNRNVTPKQSNTFEMRTENRIEYGSNRIFTSTSNTYAFSDILFCFDNASNNVMSDYIIISLKKRSE